MDIINLRDTRDFELLQQVYNELYLTCFTDLDEQEDLEQYRSRLFDPQLPEPNPETHFLVAGENLISTGPNQIFGLMIFEFYRQSSCGLLTYIAVSPAMRGCGLGRTLMNKAREILKARCTQGLKAIFGETHDPAKVDASKDAMSPHQRIEVMKRLGAKLVPIRYVQPELRPKADRSRKLLFISFPLSQNEPLLSSSVIDFLDEFYRALGVADPQVDVDFMNAKSDIESAENNSIDLEIVRIENSLGLAISDIKKNIG